MLSEFKIRYIKNALLTGQQAEKIAKLKQQHWNYPVESQLKWMKENINDDEYHLCLESDGAMIAYLNIVFLKIKFDDRVEETIGIGNVCVDKRFTGQGVGLMLMQICNYFIKCQDKRAVLLCKKKLLTFYQKSGWKEYRGNVLFQGEKFDGTLMFNELQDETNIEFERNF